MWLKVGRGEEANFVFDKPGGKREKHGIGAECEAQDLVLCSVWGMKWRHK